MTASDCLALFATIVAANLADLFIREAWHRRQRRIALAYQSMSSTRPVRLVESDHA